MFQYSKVRSQRDDHVLLVFFGCAARKYCQIRTSWCRFDSFWREWANGTVGFYFPWCFTCLGLLEQNSGCAKDQAVDTDPIATLLGVMIWWLIRSKWLLGVLHQPKKNWVLAPVPGITCLLFVKCQIFLKILHSQMYKLEICTRFYDLGNWAVNSWGVPS